MMDSTWAPPPKSRFFFSVDPPPQYSNFWNLLFLFPSKWQFKNFLSNAGLGYVWRICLSTLMIIAFVHCSLKKERLQMLSLCGPSIIHTHSSFVWMFLPLVVSFRSLQDFVITLLTRFWLQYGILFLNFLFHKGWEKQTICFHWFSHGTWSSRSNTILQQIFYQYS